MLCGMHTELSQVVKIENLMWQALDFRKILFSWSHAIMSGTILTSSPPFQFFTHLQMLPVPSLCHLRSCQDAPGRTANISKKRKTLDDLTYM